MLVSVWGFWYLNVQLTSKCFRYYLGSLCFALNYYLYIWKWNLHSCQFVSRGCPLFILGGIKIWFQFWKLAAKPDLHTVWQVTCRCKPKRSRDASWDLANHGQENRLGGISRDRQIRVWAGSSQGYTHFHLPQISFLQFLHPNSSISFI